MHCVNGVKTTFGYGGMRQAIVGEYLRTSGRILPISLSDDSSWRRIAWIAAIQARTWMYSGPYGYGDMDMLGTNHQISI